MIQGFLGTSRLHRCAVYAVAHNLPWRMDYMQSMGDDLVGWLCEDFMRDMLAVT
jgi:hypothetical protein